MNNIEESWDFWKEIIMNPDGTINIEQLKKELSDFSFIIKQLPKIYYHITGGILSKHMYSAETIIDKADEYYSECTKQNIKQMLNDLLISDDINNVTYKTLVDKIQSYF